MAEINLQALEHPAKRTLHGGTGYFEMSENDRIRIQTSPPGVEVLDERVPSGKVWMIMVSVSIIETDA